MKAIRLTKGQKLLYELICETLAQDKPLSLFRAQDLYVKDVRRADYYDREWFSETRGYQKFRHYYSETETKAMALQWLLRNLGALVTKGALKVVPQIELSDVDGKP